MDLKIYYQKIRQMESSISEPYPIVISCETADGGRSGVLTEVSRVNGARMIVEGTARQASASEAAAYRKAQAEAKRAADEAEAARTLQFKGVSIEDAASLAGSKTAPDRK